MQFRHSLNQSLAESSQSTKREWAWCANTLYENLPLAQHPGWPLLTNIYANLNASPLARKQLTNSCQHLLLGLFQVKLFSPRLLDLLRMYVALGGKAFKHKLR